MSNPGGVDFNVSPYYDDYNEDDKFVRILFRPGRAVQARELTQLQTIVQKQIQRFGNYFFKEGSIIDGCEQGLDLNLSYVKIEESYDSNTVNLSNFLDKTVVGANTGITAKVGLVSDIEGQDPKTLFINYTSSGLIALSVNTVPTTLVSGNTVSQSTSNATGIIQYFDTSLSKVYISSSNNITDFDELAPVVSTLDSTGTEVFMEITEIVDNREAKRFENSEIIFTETVSTRNYSQAISSNATTHVSGGRTYDRGSKITVGDGIIYTSDHFIKHDTQTIILDKYTNSPSYKVGVIPSKEIVDYLEDTDLVDNAAGTPNYQAPGADRFKINTVLSKIALNSESADTEFITLSEIENGLIKKKKSFAIENKLEEVISKRTYEESGDYTLSNPKINIREHLIQGNNGGRYSSSEGGNTNLLLIEVDPFTSYVKGFRNEFTVKQNISLEKGIDVQEIDQSKTQINYGNYIEANELVGSWDIMGSTSIELHNIALQALTNKTFSSTVSSASKIGEARVRLVEHVTGVPGTPSARYRIHLFDIRMSSGSFGDVKSLYYGNSGNLSEVKKLADVILDSNGKAVLKESAFNTMIFKLPYDAVRRIRDADNNIESAFSFKTEYQITLNGGQGTVSSGDISESFSGTSVLSETQKLRNYDLVVASNTEVVASTSIGGTVSVSAGTSTVTGSSTSFLTRVNIGDYLRINGETHQVESIASNTSLTLATTHSAGATSVAAYKSFPPGVRISLSGYGSSGLSRKVEVLTGGTSVNIDLGETVTINARLISTMIRVNAREMKKVLQVNAQVVIDANTHPLGFAGPYSLGQCDIYALKAVYQSADFDTEPTTSDTVVTTNFNLDNGQRDSMYLHGTITPIDSSLVTGKLLVVYDYFSQDSSQGIGYFSVDSYPVDDVNETATTINTSDIPFYISATNGSSYNLRDCLDFRVRKSANTASENPLDNLDTFQYTITKGIHSPVSVSDFDADLSIYKGRVAKLFLNERGEFGIIDGSPGYPTPQTPSSIPGTLDLAILTVPPYPSLPNDVVIEPQKNRRYTMKDIGKIEDRVNRLEYYTSLNLLEKQTTDITILDENGLNRFKNGILVDPYVGHNVADVNNSDMASSISRRNKFATSQIALDQIPLKFNGDLQSVVMTQGGKLFMPYTEEVFSDNPYASLGINLSQLLSYDFIGVLETYPSSDNWFDETNYTDKTIVIDVEGNSDNWRKISNAWETEYDSWQTRWLGVPVQQEPLASKNNVGSIIDPSTNQYDIISSSVVVGPTESQTQSRIVDISVNHFARSRDYVFKIIGLKPNTILFAFFDGVDVTEYCQQIELATDKTVSDVYALADRDGNIPADASVYSNLYQAGYLYSDSNGEIIGIYSLPAEKFTVGTREFRLCDDSLNRNSFITTLAKNTILIQGLSLISTGSQINTRPLNVNFSASVEGSNVSKQIRTQDNQNAIFRDPLSQSFYVDDTNYPYGMFLTKIDLFFKTKSSSANKKVYLQIREMENGLPTKRTIGDSTCFVRSSDITISETGDQATTFTFNSPIFLLPGTEYCFSVIAENNSDEFELWISELGNFDLSGIDNQKRIEKQPAAGTLFTSSNDFTWSVRQTQDVKYKMYNAVFDVESTSTAVFNNVDTDAATAYSAFVVNVGELVPDRTNILYDINVSDTNALLSGNFKVDNLERVQLSSQKSILTSSDESNNSIKSIYLTSRLTTRNRYISPFIDLQRVGVILFDNKINNATQTLLTGTANVVSSSTSVVGTGTLFENEILPGEFVKFGDVFRKVVSVASNTSLSVETAFTVSANDVVLTSRNEENPKGPYSSSARYITRRVELAEGFDANDLNVYVEVNRPAGTNIKVYCKVLNSSDSDAFDDKFYIEMPLSGVINITDNSDTFVEEKYVIPESLKIGGNITLSGTLAIASASSNIVGTSTRFLEELVIGDTISVSGETKLVSSIANNEFLTTDSTFSTTTSGITGEKLLYNSLVYVTPDNRSYSTYKYFAIKVVFLSDNAAIIPKIKKLRAIAVS